MANVNLTKNVVSEITTNIDNLFTTRLQNEMQASQEFLDLFDSLYTLGVGGVDARQVIENLPSGWLPVTSTIRFVITYMSDAMPNPVVISYEPSKFPALHGKNYAVPVNRVDSDLFITHFYGGTDSANKFLLDMGGKGKATLHVSRIIGLSQIANIEILRNPKFLETQGNICHIEAERQQLLATVRATLAACKTLNQVIQVWPSVTDYVSDGIKERLVKVAQRSDEDRVANAAAILTDAEKAKLAKAQILAKVVTPQ